MATIRSYLEKRSKKTNTAFHNEGLVCCSSLRLSPECAFKISSCQSENRSSAFTYPTHRLDFVEHLC